MEGAGMLTDKKEFKLFFQDYFDPVFRFTRRYTEDHAIARDITQETFIQVYEKREDFDSLEKAKSFAYTTAKNRCLDHLKHKRIREQYANQPFTEVEEPEFLHEITYQETYRILHAAIRQLPSQSRAIILHSLNGKNNTEIAETMAISVNTVKTLKKGAYKTLRALLGNHYFSLLLLFVAE